MSRTWTIFGAGNLIGDLCDTIDLIGDELENVVINQPLRKEVKSRIPRTVQLITLNDFQSFPTECYIFGYVDPDKTGFLDTLKKYEPLNFSNLIHPLSCIAKSSDLGVGNFVAPGVVIASGAKIKDFNFLNRCCSVGHDAIIGNFNHICPNSTICGNCEIGDKNMLGASSTVIDNVKIADENIIGAGSVVTKNIIIAGTYVGIPAKRVSV
jgi:sugar O-acyltransferase (sialic acid O-acetyltransferase NeuD family)